MHDVDGEPEADTDNRKVAGQIQNPIDLVLPTSALRSPSLQAVDGHQDV